jgi:HlyD family secretion protein
MDIERKGVARKKKIRMAIIVLICLALVPIVTMGLNRLKPAAPNVDRATVWTDTVKRGPMDLQVRGLGTLVPQEIQWIPAITDGQVERRLVFPGTAVKARTVLTSQGLRP